MSEASFTNRGCAGPRGACEKRPGALGDPERPPIIAFPAAGAEASGWTPCPRGSSPQHPRPPYPEAPPSPSGPPSPTAATRS